MSKYGLTLVTDEEMRKASILIMGEGGVGKTSLTKTLPAEPEQILYVCADPGYMAIRDFPCKMFNIVSYRNPVTGETMSPMGAMHFLLTNIASIVEEEGIRWVVIDGLNDAAEVVKTYSKKKEEANPTGKGGKVDSFRHWSEMTDYMTEFILTFRDLVGVSTLFITHDSFDENRCEFVPDFPGKALASTLHRKFDGIGHMRIERDDEGKAVQRFIQFDPDCAKGYAVKDRAGVLKGFQEPNIKMIVDKIYGALSAEKEE